jgi:hypothetical protein
MSLDGVFVRDGDRFLATDLALGPWAEGALHGGAPAALLARCFVEAAPNGLRPARITYEFVRPVPVGPLAVRIEVVRPGRRVTLLDAWVTDPDGIEVTRARALLTVPTKVDVTALSPPPFPGPDAGETNDWSNATPMFSTHALEIRFVEGAFRRPGPATAWFRLREPLLAGSDVLPVERVTAAADFGNGIASVVSWEEHTFINPDLTVYLERDPIGEWVALQSEMRVTAGSVALAESVLWDQRGRIGRATQALLVSRIGE